MIIQLNVDEGLPRASARSQRVIASHLRLRAVPREPLTKLPMKNRQNNSRRASALQITFISLSAVLLTLTAAPARNQFDGTG